MAWVLKDGNGTMISEYYATKGEVEQVQLHYKIRGMYKGWMKIVEVETVWVVFEGSRFLCVCSSAESARIWADRKAKFVGSTLTVSEIEVLM